MAWWELILDSLAVVALFLLLTGGFLFFRRRWLSREGGTFECSVRMRPPRGGGAAASRGWMLGLGRYSGDQLEWFRIFSFSPRPKHVFPRSMEVIERRTPHGPEAFALYAGHIALRVLTPSGAIELAMSQSALTGFLAWTEAAPPGHDRLFN
jgi:hypothetical protein